MCTGYILKKMMRSVWYSDFFQCIKTLFYMLQNKVQLHNCILTIFCPLSLLGWTFAVCPSDWDAGWIQLDEAIAWQLEMTNTMFILLYVTRSPELYILVGGPPQNLPLLQQKSMFTPWIKPSTSGKNGLSAMYTHWVERVNSGLFADKGWYIAPGYNSFWRTSGSFLLIEAASPFVH